MFNITIKRSVATLGVVAGLLAAAVPASAGAAAFIPEVGDEVLAVKAPRPNSSEVPLMETNGLKAGASEVLMETVTLFRAEEPQGTDASLGRANSIEYLRDGTSNTVQFAETGRSDAKTPSLIANGTQVGSEGVKAPVVVLTGADDYGFTEGNDQPCRCDD